MNTALTAVPARLPRYRRVENFPPIDIGRPKRAILEAVSKFHYLTANQLTLLLFSAGSLKYTREHCKELFHAEYLRRLYLPKATPMGSSKAIYALDGKGYRFLRGLGDAPEGRFRPSEEGQREKLQLEHSLSCNDFLILASRLARQDSGIVVAEMRTEREMKRIAGRVEVYNPDRQQREPIAVIPDGWLELHVDDSYKVSLALEMDRATMEKKALMRKLRGLVGRYSAEPAVVVVILTLGGPKRLAEAVGWVEAVLEEVNAKQHADLFRMAAFDPAEVDPREAFLASIWRQPFSPGGRPLLERG